MPIPIRYVPVNIISQRWENVKAFFLALFKKVFVRSSVYLQLQAVKAVQNEFYCIIATLQNTPTPCMFSALGSQLLQKTHFV